MNASSCSYVSMPSATTLRPHLVGESDQGLDHRPPAPVELDVAGEPAIEFDVVWPEFDNRLKARLPSPGVVNRNQEPAGAEAAEHAAHAVEVVNLFAFREFEDHALGGETELAGGRLERPSGGVAGQQRQGRDIQKQEPLGREARPKPRDGADAPGMVHFGEEAFVGGRSEEALRSIQRWTRRWPSERLEAKRIAVRQRDNPLAVGAKSTGFQRRMDFPANGGGSSQRSQVRSRTRRRHHTLHALCRNIAPGGAWANAWVRQLLNRL